MDTHPIIDAIWQLGKICYLPVIHSYHLQSHELDEAILQFARYQANTMLHQNRYGILEPVDSSEYVRTCDLDLVVMPLVGFDALGNRLGTGGGYYDRTFAFSMDTKDKRPFFLGIAFAIQQVEELHADPWDVSLDAVITEQGMMKFKV
jgi:5-formyltetrahydrofolate cyclo-ligase